VKSDGNEIFLDGRYGKWVNVKYGNNTGSVFSGFLCDFKPDAVIKAAADFYRDKNKNDKWYSQHKGLTHFKDSEVIIENIVDNHIVLSAPLTVMDGTPCDSKVVWRYDVKQKKFFEAYYFDNANSIEILYLDNDKYPDLVVDSSCCSSMIITFYLGSEKGFIKIDEFSGDDSTSYYTVGSCGDVEIACREVKYDRNTDKTDSSNISYYRFNCNKRKFEKYAAGKISDYLVGNIVSVDFKNISIAIEDSKEISYNFSDKTSVYHQKSHKNIKVKDLKKGDKVIFEYVTIDGEKTILDMQVCE
jgi:Cu/Ag efflux protein CusF